MTLPPVEAAVALAADATSEAHRGVVAQTTANYGTQTASVFHHRDGGAHVLLSTAGPLPDAVLTAELTPEVRETRETMMRALLKPHLDAPCTCKRRKVAGCRPHDTEKALGAVLEAS